MKESDEPSFMGESDDSEKMEIKFEIDEYRRINESLDSEREDHINNLLGEGALINPDKIEENAKLLHSELV